MNIQNEIKQQLSQDKIVLYMKGSPDFPQCGFSSRAVQLLRECGVGFASYNVLDNPELREGIKQYGNWPTIPQLYINGELIGGSDIMNDLFAKGDLQAMVQNA